MNQQSTPNIQPFSGSIRELLKLALPICLITLSTSLVLFIERLFYARLSAETMEAAVNVMFVYSIFQAPCLVLVMMAQVCVGRLQGASQNKEIGSTIWQFIWFSLLSSFIVIPLGMLFGMFYFKNTSIGPLALPYLFSLLSINFLYPLAATLSSFYIGRGKTRLCLLANVAVGCVNLLVAYPLILGIERWIPSYGLLGGALGNLIAQSMLVTALFAIFVSPRYAERYGTRQWHLRPKLFWDSIYPGLLRAANRVSTILCLACMSHVMIAKQGDYLLCWSLGGTIAFFLPFGGEAICQALTTVTSNILGAKNAHLLNRVSANGYLLISIIIALAGLPLLLFPLRTFHFLFPEITLSDSSVRNLFLGVWLTFSSATLCYVPISRLLACKDTQFFLITGSLCWIKSYTVVYLAVNTFGIPADQCVTMLCFSNFIDFGLYQWRVQYKQTSLLNAPLQQSA